MDIKNNEFYIRIRCGGNRTTIIGQLSYDHDQNQWVAKNDCNTTLDGYGKDSIAAVIDMLKNFNT